MLCSVCCFVFVLSSLSCTVSSQWRSHIGTMWRSHCEHSLYLGIETCYSYNVTAFSHENHLKSFSWIDALGNNDEQKSMPQGLFTCVLVARCSCGIKVTTLSQFIAAHPSCPTIALCITAFNPQYCMWKSVFIKEQLNSSWTFCCPPMVETWNFASAM